MATVHHPVEDDAASVSSVPESHYQGDSDSDDEMDSMLTAQPVAAPPMSAKAREAQAETIRARQIARQHRNNAGTSTQQVDDDIPPPPYSEALGLAEPARASVTLPPVNSEDVDIEAQNHVNEHSPVLETTQPFPDYGTAGHRTHGNAEEAGYGRGRRYTDVSDDTSDPSADELEQRRQQRKAGKQRGRFCGVWRRRKRDDDPRWLSTEARDKRRRSRMKKLIICILLLAPLAFILDQLLASLIDHSDHRRKGSPGGSNPSQPDPTDPSQPPYDDQPPYDGKPPYDGGNLVNRVTTCRNAEWGPFTSTSLNPEADFGLLEAVKYSGDLRGTVRIVMAPSTQEEYITASVAYAKNPTYGLSGTGFIRDDDGLVLVTPNLEGADSWTDWPCLDIDVVISIRPDTPLNRFAINSNHFSISVSPDLFATNPDDKGLHVNEDAFLRTLSGSISVPYLSAENVEISSASGSIHGKFALYHRLNIDSISGSVNVEIDPKPAPKDDAAQPAELTIKTRSGSIKAHMPTKGKIPNRIYRTKVSSSSSSLSGEYIFGDKGEFNTNSGSIRTELLPYIFNYPAKHKSVPGVDAKSNCSDYSRYPLELTTLTASSSTHLTVLDPYDPFSDACDMPEFKSMHGSSSGSLNIEYPRSWTGKIFAQTVAGSINVHGDNLELLSLSWRSWLMNWGKSKGTWKRHDSKGNVGLGDIKLDTISSSINLNFAR